MDDCSCLLKLFSLLLLLDEESNLLPCPGKTATPALDKLSNEISDMKTQLASLIALKNTGLSLVKPEKIKELKNLLI